MAACFSCHSLCENPNIYRVYYGVESFKPYAPGNYDEYNEKAISEKVVSEKVYICIDCIAKAKKRYANIYKYVVKLWMARINHSAGIKCCYRCHHLSDSRFCEYYKYLLPWWVTYLIDTDKIEPTIDLLPVRKITYCKGWEPLSSLDENSLDSLKSQLLMAFYFIKYHNKSRVKLKSFLFNDLFSFNNFADEIKSFLNSNSSGSILDLSYSYLFYKPYRNILESNIYKKYYDTRAKLKDWAEALS